MSGPAVTLEPRQDSANSGSAPGRDSRLRYHAVPFLVLVLAEILVGNQLALSGSPYPVGYLAAHVGLSIVLIALGAYLVAIAYRLHRSLAWVLSGLCFVSVVVATLSGTDFLLGSGAQSSLYAMEGFGGLALLGSLLLIILGSFPLSSRSATTR
jgi:hypothetical protein